MCVCAKFIFISLQGGCHSKKKTLKTYYNIFVGVCAEVTSMCTLAGRLSFDKMNVQNVHDFFKKTGHRGAAAAERRWKGGDIVITGAPPKNILLLLKPPTFPYVCIITAYLLLLSLLLMLYLLQRPLLS